MGSAAGAAANHAVGVLGGTFDPVHNAHLAMARAALEARGLARVIWLPTGSPPYRNAPVAASRDRLAMLRLAIEGEPRYEIDERELAPEHSGYTLDTLIGLRAELGTQTRIYLLLGADQYSKLDSWHRPHDLLNLCHIAVFARPGWNAGAVKAPRNGVIHVPMEPLAISASDIRARIGRGEDVSAMLPAAVLRYIRQHRLYGHP